MVGSLDRHGIASLLERVRAAEGADRELDRDIGVTIGGWRTGSGILASSGMGCPYLEIDGETFVDTPLIDFPGANYPSVTASLDAALALIERVRPGWFWSLGQSAWDAPAVAELCCEDPPGYSKEQAATPALALLAALLSSMQEEGEGNG